MVGVAVVAGTTGALLAPAALAAAGFGAAGVAAGSLAAGWQATIGEGEEEIQRTKIIK